MMRDDSRKTCERWLALTCLAVVSSLGACDDSSETRAAATCAPGEPLECVSTNGCQGVQICADAGDRVGPCVCEGDGSAGGATSTVGGGRGGDTGGAVSVGGTGTCGNGVREGLEACDGADLGGARCASVTNAVAWEGVVRCRADCTLDGSGCIAPTGTCPTTDDNNCDEPLGCPRGTDTNDCCVTDDFYCGVEGRTCIGDGCCMDIVSCALDNPCFDVLSCNQPTTCESAIAGCGGPESPGALHFDALEACFGLCARTPSHAGPGEPACAIAEPAPAEADLYFMLDRSTTMGEPLGTAPSKWDAVLRGMEMFMNDASMVGTGVGVQFFALPDSCNPDVYATPAVPVGLLPLVAVDILNALFQAAPTEASRPLAPALQGALQYAQSRAALDPTRPSAVVLVTDGFPTACGVRCTTAADCSSGVCTGGMCDPGTSVSELAALAERFATGTPPVGTHVVALGSGLGNLSTLARGGGTGSAYLFESGDIASALANALSLIATSVEGCRFRFCDGRPVPSPEDLIVRLSDPSFGDEILVPRLEDAGQCDGAGMGWYFDDRAAESRIALCPAACSSLHSLDISFEIFRRPVPEGGVLDAGPTSPAIDTSGSDASLQSEGGAPDGG